ncbi:hypothetical protein ACHWQZ_G007529 [Mnemiopsis leidyi]
MKIELQRDCDDNYLGLQIIRFEKLTSWWSLESGCFPGLCTCSKSHSIAWPKDPGGTENHNERSVLDWPATEQPFEDHHPPGQDKATLTTEPTSTESPSRGGRRRVL